MQKKKKIILIVIGVVLFTVMCCAVTVLLGLASTGLKSLGSITLATQDLENYTVENDMYLRFQADEDKYPNYWVNVDTTRSINKDGDWRATMDYKSTNYESYSKSAWIDETLMGKISYEAENSDVSWKKVEKEFPVEFKHNEPNSVSCFTEYDELMQMITSDTWGVAYRTDFSEDKFYIITKDDREIIKKVLPYLTECLNYRNKERDYEVSEVDHLWIAVSVVEEGGEKVELHFRDAQLKMSEEGQDESRSYTVDGGFTITLGNIGSTKVNSPM
jgi:hypothetical protein